MKPKALILSISFWLLSATLFAQQIDVSKDYGLNAITNTKQPNFGSSAYSVIVFYAPECPICISTTKALNELAAIYQAKVPFYLVYPSNYYSNGFIRKFHKKYGLKLPAFKDKQKALVHALQASITPQVFVIDNKGNVLYNGKIDNQYEDVGQRRTVVTAYYLRDALDSVLKGEQPAIPFTKAVGCFIED